jgi:hypothetical protein
VQRDPVPNPGLLHDGRQRIAGLGKNRLQSTEPSGLLGRSVEWDAEKNIHI